VDEHPHRGFETVTIVFEGELEHRDSSGGSGRIGPGDVQWMTAASGVVHEEKQPDEFTRKGGRLEMVQLWVNLPAKDKMSPPRYQTLLSREIPVVDVANGGGKLRVIAGSFRGVKGPAKTFAPVNVFDVELDAGHRFNFSIPPEFTGAIVVLRGRLHVNGQETVKHMEVLLFANEGELVTARGEQDTRFLVLSGEPIDEPIAAYGPFVMNTEKEIEQAFADYRAGRLGTLGIRIKPREATGT
jgi:redox-sensitive bicupin YhaK (pirin superfamily)